jgi:hypothetical protein
MVGKLPVNIVIIIQDENLAEAISNPKQRNARFDNYASDASNRSSDGSSS